MSLDEHQLAALEAAAKAWEGTPFCEGSPLKGVAVSCQHLAAQTLMEAGLMPIVEIPNGPTNWRGQSRSLIAEWIEQSGLFLDIGKGKTWRELITLTAPADVLGFLVGGSVHHIMLQLQSGRVFHSLSRHKACIAPAIPAEWEQRLTTIWRLKTLL